MTVEILASELSLRRIVSELCFCSNSIHFRRRWMRSFLVSVSHTPRLDSVAAHRLIRVQAATDPAGPSLLRFCCADVLVGMPTLVERRSERDQNKFTA